MSIVFRYPSYLYFSGLHELSFSCAVMFLWLPPIQKIRLHLTLNDSTLDAGDFLLDPHFASPVVYPTTNRKIYWIFLTSRSLSLFFLSSSDFEILFSRWISISLDTTVCWVELMKKWSVYLELLCLAVLAVVKIVFSRSGRALFVFGRCGCHDNH